MLWTFSRNDKAGCRKCSSPRLHRPISPGQVSPGDLTSECTCNSALPVNLEKPCAQPGQAGTATCGTSALTSALAPLSSDSATNPSAETGSSFGRAESQSSGPGSPSAASWKPHHGDAVPQWQPVPGLEKKMVDLSKLYIGDKFGEGTFGKVYRGYYREQEVAVKIVKLPAEGSDDEGNPGQRELIRKHFWQEAIALSVVEHPHVLKLLGASQKGPTLCMITQYMPGGTLRNWLLGLGHQPPPTDLAVQMAVDIASGMSFVHSQGYIHRDLKPDNLLLDEQLRVKVSDFGLARVEDAQGYMTNEMGTCRWMAPEIMELKPYSRKADVFSFGVVFWQLLTGEQPYVDMTPMQAAFAVCTKDLRPPVPECLDPALAKLLETCWHRDPEARPDFGSILAQLSLHLQQIRLQTCAPPTLGLA